MESRAAALTFQKRVGPGALEHRGARHLRLCEGFLVHTSAISESGKRVAFALQSCECIQIVEGALRLAAAYDLNHAWTLR